MFAWGRRSKFLLVGALLLVGISLIVLPWFTFSSKWHERKARFDAVQEGMSKQDVMQQVLPEGVNRVGVIDGLHGMDITLIDTGGRFRNRESIQESPGAIVRRGSLLPNSKATFTFVNGELTEKEFANPTFTELIGHWFALAKSLLRT
jgi:hypothetical protein